MRSIRNVILLIAAATFGLALGHAGEIRGRVTDAAGAPVAGVAILIQRSGTAAPQSIATGADGGFVLANLSAGSYTIRASKAGYAETRQGPIELSDGGPAVALELRLQPARETEAVRGAEERNPNDFIVRLDTNAVQNELARVGAPLRYQPEFRADRSYYGDTLGYPLRGVQLASAGRPLAAYHGALYESHQDQALNARPFFQVGALKPSRRNQYGFNVSGPLQKEKLWFSFALDEIRDTGFVNGNVQVPLADERTPRSTDPALNAMIAALLKAFPNELPNLPNVSPRHLNTNAPRDIRSTAFSAHFDYRLGEAHRIAFDQQFQDYTEEPFELVIGQNPETLLRPQAYHLTYSYTKSPRTVVQVAFNFDRLRALLLPTKAFQALLAPLGVDVPPDVKFGDEISDIGGQPIPRHRFENHFFLNPQISHSQGRHSLSAGFSLLRFRDNDLRSDNVRGVFSFSNDFGRTAVQNFLLGTSSQLQLGLGNFYRGFRNWESALYFQDQFKYRPNLTLSAGLRWEVQTAPREVNGLTRFSYSTDWNNLAPQLGLAWNPRGGKTVIRSGFGITFGHVFLATYTREKSNPPEIQQLVIPAPTLLALTDPAIRQIVPGQRVNLNKVSTDLVAPYDLLYNLSIERPVGGNSTVRIAYEGSRMLKMFFPVVTNRALPGTPLTSATVNARRPDARYSRVYTINNNSRGYSDTLEASFSKRMSRGLALEARYNYGKSLETSGSDFADDSNSGVDVNQSSDIFSDLKGPARFDIRHAFSLNYTYDVPRFSGPHWVAALLGGWTISGTTILRSGTPFAVFTGSDGPEFGNVDGEAGDRPNLRDPQILGKSIDNPDTSRAVLLGSEPCITVPRPGQDPYYQCQYFDSNLPPGGRGNLGYRTFRKDGTHNWNLALARSFHLPSAGTEKQVQFRSEFFNFFNTPQFSAPGNSLSSPTFGQITNTVNKGRVIQLSLRLVF